MKESLLRIILNLVILVLGLRVFYYVKNNASMWEKAVLIINID